MQRNVDGYATPPPPPPPNAHAPRACRSIYRTYRFQPCDLPHPFRFTLIFSFLFPFLLRLARLLPRFTTSKRSRNDNWRAGIRFAFNDRKAVRKSYIYTYMYASRGKDITFEENRLASDAYYPLPLTAELPILVFSTGALNIGAFTGTV